MRRKAHWTSLAVALVSSAASFSAAHAGTVRKPHAMSLPSLTKASYFPHWVTREGAVTPAIMTRLAPGTIIGAHHHWQPGDLQRILDFPGKRFRISWYAESNVLEHDDPIAKGTPVKARICEARRKQLALSRQYGRGRFANLIELDGARDKKDGNLQGPGNEPTDWLADAVTAKSAGFRLIAKSPAPQHVDELRSKLGTDIVPRIVFEDVTAKASADNPGYRRDAKTLAARGETVTLVVHEGAYGGFQPTPLTEAEAVIHTDFKAPDTEAYWGRASTDDGFELLKPLEGASAAARPIPQLPSATPAR